MGLLASIVVVCMFLHWHRVQTSRFDTGFRQNLAGTWSSTLDNMCLTNTVMPDGSFTIQAIFKHSARTNSYQMTGTWLVRDKRIVETVKSDTNPTARTPRTITGRIIHADGREFTVRWGISPDEWIWKKIGQSLCPGFKE